MLPGYLMRGDDEIDRVLNFKGTYLKEGNGFIDSLLTCKVQKFEICSYLGTGIVYFCSEAWQYLFQNTL
jgi:hypothetical protein